MGDKIKKKDKKLLMEFINEAIEKAIEDYLDSAIENYIDEHIDELRDRILNRHSDVEIQSIIADADEKANSEADNEKTKQLEDELAAAKKELERVKEDNQRLREEEEKLQTRASEDGKRAVEFMKSAIKAQREYDKLEKECSAVKATQNNLIAEKNDLQNRFDVVVKQKQSIQSDYDNLKIELEEEKTAHQEDNNKKDTAYNDLKIEFNNVRQTVEQTKSELNNYKQVYSSLEEVYKLYQSFDENTKTGLRGIFNDADSPLDFICGGAQVNSLDGLWDYLKNRINSNQLSREQQDDFNKLFDFCFDMANKGKTVYVRLSADTDVDFNGEEMNRTSDSNQLGEVREVLFAGYRYIDGNIVKKTLVRLG